MLWSATGNTMKNTSDGTITQRMDHERSATSPVSRVSRYNQIAARIDVSGSEISTAARSEERRAISLAAAITAPDKSALSRRYTAAGLILGVPREGPFRMSAADRLMRNAHDYEALAASHSERELLVGRSIVRRRWRPCAISVGAPDSWRTH